MPLQLVCSPEQSFLGLLLVTCWDDLVIRPWASECACRDLRNDIIFNNGDNNIYLAQNIPEKLYEVCCDL